MAKRLKMRRTGLVAVAGFLGASASLGLAGTAGAASVPNANTIIYGGGSNTTYEMMTALSTLFNESPGCDLAAPSGSTQNLNYGCPDPANTTGGENGLGDGSGYTNTATGMTSPQGDPENPFNDVVVEMPPLGSGNGIKELDQLGTNPFAIQFARSSRGPNNGLPVPTGDAPSNTAASDPEGLNFVAYAADAVPWLHWTKVSGKKTPSAKLTSLSIPQLAAIYNGTDTDWSQVGGTAGPIDVYMAQSGSGTESTWQTDLGLSSATPAGVTDPATHVIFENEIASILKNGDEADAIFYFSYGKFQVSCDAKTAECGGAKTPGASAMALGDESLTTGAKGIVPSETTILNGSFPTDRYLYNVYTDGNNTNLPAPSPAAENFVSEAGFICKQDSAIDSNSGNSYGSEITSTIEAYGFYPLGSGTIDAADNPTTPTNVSFNSSSNPGEGYAFVDPLAGNITPSTTGNCRVFTTDADGNAG